MSLDTVSLLRRTQQNLCHFVAFVLFMGYLPTGIPFR